VRPIRWLSIGLSWILIALVRFYQLFIGPWLPAMCRFEPSCSRYMVQAIRRRGPVVGLLMGIWRLLRCNPFFRGGYDPVE
jgi:putative membrane protein insertion efficiency factor